MHRDFDLDQRKLKQNDQLWSSCGLKEGKTEGEALGFGLEISLVDVLGLLFRTTLKLEKGNSVWLTLRLAEGEAYGDTFQF